MKITRILAIRHGETAWNVDTRIQGQIDIPLNDHGRWQAQQLAKALAHEDIHAIYASDLSRAFDTALAVASTKKIPIEARLQLRERHFGDFQGHTWEDIQNQWPEDAELWRVRHPEWTPQGGGESLIMLNARIAALFHELASPHEGQQVLWGDAWRCTGYFVPHGNRSRFTSSTYLGFAQYRHQSIAMDT